MGLSGGAILPASFGAAGGHIEGLDLNAERQHNDITAQAYRVRRPQRRRHGARSKEIGHLRDRQLQPRRQSSQLNLRVSKCVPHCTATARIEAIAEVFNLFNAKNPAPFTTRAAERDGTSAPNPHFMQPTEFAGDFQNPEQRVGQIGFRFTF